MNSSIQHLLDYAESIHPNSHLDPADLLPTGKHPLPGGFTLSIDAFSERVTLFGPAGEQGVRVPHAAPWGNGFKILGLDLLRSLTHVLELGEPSPKRTLDERRQYFLTLLATAAPFSVPERGPMDRIQLDAHLDNCETCAPAMAALSRAIDGGRSLPKEHELRDLLAKAHAPVTTKPARLAAQPNLAAAGKES